VKALCGGIRAKGIGSGFLKATVYKGRALENRHFAEFSFSEWLVSGELSTSTRNNIETPESPGPSGFSVTESIAQIDHH
jgi:hypothetical protein